MHALPSSWARALSARQPARVALGVHPPDKKWKRFNSNNFSTVLPLEHSAAKCSTPMAQRQAHLSSPVADTVLEEVSDEYSQDFNHDIASVASPSIVSTTLATTSTGPQTSIHPDIPGESALLSIPNFPAIPPYDDAPIAAIPVSKQIVQQVDTTVFETISSEYLDPDDASREESHWSPSPCASVDTSSTRKGWVRSHRVMSRCTGLRETVENGDYARAEILRGELLEAGVQIKRHPVYADAALHAWRSQPVEGRTERFYEWFRLIPSASLGRVRRGRRAIQIVRRNLFAEPSDLNTIACFGLVAARKGYANYISIDTLTHIARFASPGVSSAYFDNVERSALKFYERFGKGTIESSEFSRWNAEKWHNMFIRALCFAGYVDACIDRLSHVLQTNRELSISPFTWVVLLETFIRLERADLVAAVRDLRAESSRMESSADSAARSDPPSARFLARMIHSYIESGQLQELDDLRHELMKPSMRPDLWAMAQMKYYMDKEQYIVVLRQFTHFYSNIGVPKEVVLPYVREDIPLSHRKYNTTHPLLPLISPPTHVRGINRWPSSHTLSLVWRALVQLVESLPALQTLYQSFLTYLDQHRPTTSSEASNPTVPQKEFLPSIRFQYPPAMSPDTVHFHIFIMAFARVAGPSMAIQVFSDMQVRGIQPDVYNWTALAGHYAGQDDVERATRILARMESTLADAHATPARSSELTHTNRTRVGPVSREAGWIPEPNLVTYTTIVRGLVDRGNFQEAKRLAERMEAAGYVPGTDERTDMVLELLRQRERSPRVPWNTGVQ